jgi:hypothetical protein
MANFAETVDADRRMMILKLMVEEGGQSNDGTLITALRMMGDRKYLDQEAVRRLMRELATRDCITIDIVRDTVMVGRITERGRMAVAGDVVVGGVASPHNGL